MRIDWDKVFTDFAGGRRLGYIVKRNTHTVWVKIMMGAKSSITIKRHIIKHNCF